MGAVETKTTRAWSARRARARSLFQDRADAGRQLAQRLLGFAKREDCVVLALPRGGVLVAGAIARKLKLPIDVLLARKLGVPGHEEQTFGAIAADSGAVLDYELIRAARITPEQVSAAMDRTRAELKARAQFLRRGRPPLDLEGKAVILVDDGSTTGSNLMVGVRALKRMRPAQVVLALPVCAAATCLLLERQADLLIALKRPADLFAVDQLYLDFRPLSDDDVLRALDASERGTTKRPRADSPSEAGCADV